MRPEYRTNPLDKWIKVSLAATPWLRVLITLTVVSVSSLSPSNKADTTRILETRVQRELDEGESWSFMMAISSSTKWPHGERCDGQIQKGCIMRGGTFRANGKWLYNRYRRPSTRDNCSVSLFDVHCGGTMWRCDGAAIVATIAGRQGQANHQITTQMGTTLTLTWIDRRSWE